MELSNLKSAEVFQNFLKICQIPHPSHHEEQIRAYLIEFAKQRNLTVESDQFGNVFIKKPATQGMENKPTIALQAHMDMVPQKTATSTHNFLTDPITTYVDGDWLKATDTTLGADNGIGLAMILTVLASDDIAHPALEALITATEEDGMVGASNLATDKLSANLMLNLDTEDLGDVYIGCAGGVNADVTFPYTTCQTNLPGYKITIKGLRGGHSGCDIDQGRESAVSLAKDALGLMHNAFNIELNSFTGGSVRNAIPREAYFTVATAAQQDEIFKFMYTLNQNFKTLYPAEQELTVTCEPMSLATVFTEQSFTEFRGLVAALPNGVIAMSNEFPGIVETSLSCGIVTTTNDAVKFTILTRSLNEQGKGKLVEDLRKVCSLNHATLALSDDYPGWDPKYSKFVDFVKDSYQEVLHINSKIQVIHAGLECGFLKAKYPNLDVLSVGPTILNPHSPDERTSITSVEQFYQVLLYILQNIPETF